MIYLVFLYCSVIFFTPIAIAQEKSTFERCEEIALSDGLVTNWEFAECTRAEIDREEARLNRAWKALFPKIKEISKETADVFLNEQRKWIAWKDESCKFWQYGFGREGVVLHQGLCRAKVIRDRADWLEEMNATEFGRVAQ